MTTDVAQSVTTPGPGSSAKALVEALFRHGRLFGVTVGVVLAATVVVTMVTPRTYESEMNILVRNSRPDYLISPERSTGQIMQHDVTEERINSEIAVLRSKDVADVVVDPDWASKPLAQRADSQIKDHEKAVIEFTKHLTVEPMRKSDLIRVAYVTTSPQAATETVERLLKAFLAKQHEIEHSSGATSFFASEAERYKRELDTAQAGLAGYQQSNQIVSLPEKEATLQTQITALEDAMRSAQVQTTEAERRVASANGQLAVLPARLSTQQRSVPNTQAVEQLTAMLTGYQNKRTELLTRFQPGDRLIAEIDQQIATTSAALASARTTNGNESTTDLNPVYQQVKAGLAASTTDVAALRGRLADLTAQHERLKQQLVNVEGSTVDYTTLQSRVAELQGNYQLYSQKRNEAQIAEAMDQQQLVNVAVAERPTFSGKAYRPLVLVNAGMGLLTALFLGACAVFFAELGRDTVASPQELEAISGVPVLATVPVMFDEFAGFASAGRPRGRTGWVDEISPEPEAPSGGIGTLAGAAYEFQPAMAEALSAGLVAAAFEERERTTESTEKQREHRESFAADVAHAMQEEVEMLTITPEPMRAPDPVRRLNRTAVKSFEQLAVGQMSCDPAFPLSPFGPPRVGPVKAVDVAPAAVERAQAVAAPAVVVAPAVALEPIDPTHRQTSSNVPVRSRLTPSQRAQLRRPAPMRDRAGYVTYTVDPRG